MLRVNKVNDLKPRYSFEAPVFKAARPNIYDDNLDSIVDLHDLLAPRSKDHYMVRVSGESMINEGIFDGDILIVNKNEQPKDGLVVIASLNGEMTVKTYRIIENKVYLFSANDKFLPIEILPFCEFNIQGVVKHVIHKV